MQPRTTAILFIVAALLGAFVYLYEIRGEAGRKQTEDAARRIFPGVESDAIDTLEFRTQDDRPLESVRAGEGWQIRVPVVFPGDDVNLDAIASTLAGLTSEAAIESPEAPEIYGLGKAARRIRFRAAGQAYGLEIGSETPVGGNVYAARDDDPKRVFTVASFRVSSFDRDLDSLRDRRVLSFDRTRVERIAAGWPGGSVKLERSAAGWAIAEPRDVSGPADEKAVEDLLSDVAFLRAEGFVDIDADDDTDTDTDTDPGASAGDGAEPYFSLRLGFEPVEGQPLEVVLRVTPERDGDDYLVRGGHPGALYRVPQARIAEFPRDLFSYRFKQLTNFESASAQSLELVFANPAEGSSMEPVSVRVERRADGWEATDGQWLAGAAARLLAEFARLEATAVVADAADQETLDSLGLSPPRVVLRAFGAVAVDGDADTAATSGELLAEVSLGNLDPDLGIAARATGQPAIYRLDAALAEQIPAGLDAYRDRFLVPPAPDL